MGIILSLGGAAFGLLSGSKLELLLVCGTAAATGNATSDLCVRSFCGWKASILASTSDLNATVSDGLTPASVISALLVFRLGSVALFNVISILLDILGSSDCEFSVPVTSDVLDIYRNKKIRYKSNMWVIVTNFIYLQSLPAPLI